MPPTVDFPTIVKQALELFGDVFDNEPARRHFAEYLTGLMVAERKNVSAINRQSPSPRINHASIAGWSRRPGMRRRSTTAVWRGYRATRKPATTPTASLPLTIPWSTTAASSSRTWAGCGTMPSSATSLPTTT